MGASDRETEVAQRFGKLVREARIASSLRQVDLALVNGVGRRFIVELEAGKPTSQLGKALRVAESLGVAFPDIDPIRDPDPELPEVEDEDITDDDPGVRIGEWIRRHQ